MNLRAFAIEIALIDNLELHLKFLSDPNLTMSPSMLYNLEMPWANAM